MNEPEFEYAVPSRARERSRTILAVAATAVAVALIVVAGWRLAKEAAMPRKRIVQQISLVQPPPPKPLPEKPPEPEKPKQEIKEEVKVPERAPKQEGPPPGEQLGLDAQGAAGGDNFGLVGRPGGRDITTLGGGGLGGDRNAWFSGVLQREIREALMRNPRLRGADWGVVVRLWLSPEGAVTRAVLAGSTGNPDTDALLRAQLAEMPPLRERPPADLAQPVRLRIASKL